MDKPADVFDRDHEWSALEGFLSSSRSGTALGLVYGRRRQGKTYLLESLAGASGGTYVTALKQSGTQNLARLAQAYQRASGTPGEVAFSTWDQAFSALLSLGKGAATPVLVVIDELPYLLEAAPEIPSVLQAILRPRSAVATQYRTRLVLCGSALSTMQALLSGSAPLRGRAALELMVHPFTYRDMARFWGTANDPELSMLLHALVGGTPAYREMCNVAPPPSVAALDQWVVSTLLNPASAMFREGNALLAEEPRVTDASVYFSVLSAIVQGATRRGQIASTVGKAEGALAHPLTVLAEAHLVTPLSDALRRRRTTYQIAEPVLRLHQLVIAPHEARLARHRGTEVWSEVADTVRAHIYGPHFEELARTWCAEHASPATLGGMPSKVAPAVVSCPEHRQSHQIDVVAAETAAQVPDRIVAIGKAKWRAVPCDVAELQRLEHLRDLIGAEGAKLLCFSKSGFTKGLRAADRARTDVELIDPTRLYSGT